MHTPEGWPEKRGTGRVGAQSCLQEGPAITGGNRGAHFGVISRSGDEALSAQRPGAVRDAGGRGRAGQQSDADRRSVGQAETKESPSGGLRATPRANHLSLPRPNIAFGAI